MPKLRQNSTSVGASPQTPMGDPTGELTALPRPLAAFKGKGKGGEGYSLSPDPLAATGGLLLREGERGNGRGGREGEGREGK